MENEYDYIEKYLKGEPSKSEKDAFDLKLLNDPEFEKAVESHRDFLGGLSMSFNRELKSLLQEEEKKLRISEAESKTKTRSINYFIGIAAVIALIMVAVFTFKNTSVETENLFAQNYQVYPNIEMPVSRSESNKENAYTFYEQGKYKEAIGLFSALNKENPLDAAPLFYTGICYLELQNAEDAVSFFEVVSDFEENKYSRPALWYEALSNIKLDRKAKAIDLLSQLAADDDNYAKQSKIILEELGE